MVANEGVFGILFRVIGFGDISETDAEFEIKLVAAAFQEIESDIRIYCICFTQFLETADSSVQKTDSDGRIIDACLPVSVAISGLLNANLIKREV